MALLERLAILITADASGAVSEMKKVAGEAEKNLGKAGQEGSKLSANMTKVGAAMMGVGAGLLAVGISAASSTTEMGREVIKLQRYTGATAEEASKLRHAAKMSGVDVETLALGLGRLSKAMAAGSPAFDKLGLSARQSNGDLKTMGEFLPELSEKLKEMPNGAEKTALMLQLFGRNGMAMLPFLNKGAEGIRELSDQAERMGVVLSQDNIGAITANIKSQRELSATFEGLRTKIGLAMMPVLTGFTNLVKSIPGPVLDIIGPLTVFGGLGLTAAGAIGMLVGQLSNLAPMVTAAAASMSSWIMAANPATLVIVGIGAALAATAAVFSIFSQGQKDDEASIGSFTDALKQQGSEMESMVIDTIAAKYANDDLTDTLNRAGVDMKGLSRATMDGGTALREFYDVMKFGHSPEEQAAAMGKLTEAQRNYAQSVLDAEAAGRISADERQKLLGELASLAESYDSAKSSSDALAASTAAMTPEVSTLEQAQNDAATATTKHVEAIDKLNNALRGTFDPVFAMLDASAKIAEGQRAVAEATAKVAEKTKALDEARATGNAEKVAAAERDLADAQDALSKSQIDATKNALNLEAAQNKLVAAVKDNPKMLDEAKAKVDAYGAAGLISAEQVTIMKKAIDDAAAAAKAGKETLDANPLAPKTDTTELDKLNAALATLRTFVDPDTGLLDFGAIMDLSSLLSGSGPTRGRASGGRVGPGMAAGGRPRNRPYLVGELGPELFFPDTAGTIVTAEKTATMLAGPAGGVAVTNHIVINMPPGSDGADVVNAIKRYEKINGKRWRQ